jgi:tetratricopeptide (TPR) repeat protein
MGNHELARETGEKALSICIELNGEENPSVGIILMNMSFIYKALSRLADAENSLMKALDINKRCLGDENTTVAQVLNLLGELYQTQAIYTIILL